MRLRNLVIVKCDMNQLNVQMSFDWSPHSHANVSKCFNFSPEIFLSVFVLQYTTVSLELGDRALIGCLTISAVKADPDWLSRRDKRHNLCVYIRVFIE